MTYIKSPLHRGKSAPSRPKKAGPMSDAFSDSSSGDKAPKPGSDGKASADNEEMSAASATRLTVEKGVA